MSISRRIMTLVTCVAVTAGIAACNSDIPPASAQGETLWAQEENMLDRNAHVFMPVKPALRDWVAQIGLTNVYPPNDAKAAEGYDGFAVFERLCLVSIQFTGAIAASNVTVEVSPLQIDGQLPFRGGQNRVAVTASMDAEDSIRRMLADARGACLEVV